MKCLLITFIMKIFLFKFLYKNIFIRNRYLYFHRKMSKLIDYTQTRSELCQGCEKIAEHKRDSYTNDYGYTRHSRSCKKSGRTGDQKLPG